MVTVDDLVWLGLLESARARLTEKFPLVVGVPERMPVEGARETPEGSCPPAMLQLYPGVPPVASSTAT